MTDQLDSLWAVKRIGAEVDIPSRHIEVAAGDIARPALHTRTAPASRILGIPAGTQLSHSVQGELPSREFTALLDGATGCSTVSRFTHTPRHSASLQRGRTGDLASRRRPPGRPASRVKMGRCTNEASGGTSQPRYVGCCAPDVGVDQIATRPPRTLLEGVGEYGCTRGPCSWGRCRSLALRRRGPSQGWSPRG